VQVSAVNKLDDSSVALPCSSLRKSRGPLAVLLAGSLLPGLAQALEVSVAGVFPGKAILVVENGPPRTVAVGQKSPEGIKVLAVESDRAMLEIDGKRRSVRIGQQTSVSGDSGGTSVTLNADLRGHFIAGGAINGTSVRFMVDTGATNLVMGPGEARRLGIDPSRGEAGYAQTANGAVRTFRLKLDTVRIGDVTVHNVDAEVTATDMPFILLGMSVLNRFEMQRDGDKMTLKKRF